MKYIYFGTPEFAGDIVSALTRAGMPPVAVVTNPDRPAGRKKIMTPPPVKSAILGFGGGIDVLQPEVLSAVFAASLAKYGAEVGVLAAYGKIVPKEVFNIFPKGIVVVHPSLLPKYRGATPIQAAILNGDTETGTTLFIMDERVDHGPIVAQRTVSILGSETYTSLAKKLSLSCAELLIEVLPKYVVGEVVPQPQDESRVTYTKKIMTDDAFVDLEATAPEKICRMVRALNPEPGVWTIVQGGSSAFAPASARQRRMKILEADYIDGKLILKKIQFEGGKPMVM